MSHRQRGKNIPGKGESPRPGQAGVWEEGTEGNRTRECVRGRRGGSLCPPTHNLGLLLYPSERIRISWGVDLGV